MTKNKGPLVSVIVNCHNGEKYLSKSINSILNQTYKNLEIIFCNNKSKDNSEKILKSFKDKRIKYFLRKNKKGRGSAVLYGFRKALKNKFN